STENPGCSSRQSPGPLRTARRIIQWPGSKSAATNRENRQTSNPRSPPCASSLTPVRLSRTWGTYLLICGSIAVDSIDAFGLIVRIAAAWLNCVRPGFACADANNLVNIGNKNFPVSDFSSTGTVGNRLDHLCR